MLINVSSIEKSYARGENPVKVLKGVSLGIEKGEFVAIMGPSGSGKSTLLNILGGLDTPDTGEVKIDDIKIQSFSDDQLSTFRRRKLGFIFQFFNLMPNLTALENVALPLLLDGKRLAEVTPKAQSLLERFGLGHRGHHRPFQLSGGEMQRVAIARALVTDPVLILADEPTGNLDSATGLSVLDLLKKLVTEQKQTLVMVTHDPKAAGFASRQIRIRDGLIESDTHEVH